MLGCVRERGRPYVGSGYFDDPTKAAAAIRELDEELTPEGIYWTLNPCTPALLPDLRTRLRAIQSIPQLIKTFCVVGILWLTWTLYGQWAYLLTIPS